MLKLGVNIDHIATLRQARLPKGRIAPAGSVFPDPLEAGRICKRAGAHSVVMHLREDRRHIQDHDVFRMKHAVPIRLNLEMAVAPSVTRVALKLKPNQVTLVPEKRQERTTESGLDLIKNRARLSGFVRACRRKKIDVSLFIDPDPEQVRAAKALGADAVEFHTGTYAEATSAAAARKEIVRLARAVRLARSLGLKAHAGHGLDVKNVKAVKEIQGLDELNIGYAIVSRALWIGFEAAVKEMMRALK